MDLSKYFDCYNLGKTVAIETACPIATPRETIRERVEKQVDKSAELCITFKEGIPAFDSRGRVTEIGYKMYVEKRLPMGFKAVANWLKKELQLETKPDMSKVHFILVSEHGKDNYRFHYHGIIWGLPNDVVERLREYLYRTVGRCRIRGIKNTPAYVDYMFKSYTGETHETWGYHSYIEV